MNKKLFPLALSALLLLPNTVFAQTPFTDVTGHWAATEIEAVYQKGYLKGTSLDQFNPEKTVTRAELAAILDRVFDFNYEGSQDLYADIAEGQWYSEAALKSGKNGIIATENGKFSPDQPVTRLEIAKAIKNSFEAKKLGVITTLMWPVFEDTVNLPQEDQNVVSFMVNTSIMKGKSDGHFGPQDNLTRAELAVVLNRTLTVKEHAFPIKEDAAAQQKTDLRGEIKEITTDAEQGTTRILIKGNIEKDTMYDQALVRITGDTSLMKGATEISLTDLKEGTKVEVEFTGPVTKSYPAQATAKAIRVLE